MMQDQRDNSYLFGGNAAYVEELYESYLHDPASVADHWRDYFDNVKQVLSERFLIRLTQRWAANALPSSS